MQFLSCEVHSLKSNDLCAQHVAESCQGSILRFLDFEILDFEIFGLSFTRYCGSPDQAQAVTQIWICHATLVPEKEKYLTEDHWRAPA